MPSIEIATLAHGARVRLQSMTLPQGLDRDACQVYLDGICRAIGNAWAAWQQQARLRNVVVNALVATGGKLEGPMLEPLILSRAPQGWEPFSRAIAAGVHNQLRSFSGAVSVPALPWYPALVYYLGPKAPPMPNVPTRLLSISVAAAHFLRGDEIASAIVQKFGNPKPAGANEMAKAVAAGIAVAVPIWLNQTMVANVMGGGQVPSFSPPFNPGGPVLMGSAEGAPGHLV